MTIALHILAAAAGLFAVAIMAGEIRRARPVSRACDFNNILENEESE